MKKLIASSLALMMLSSMTAFAEGYQAGSYTASARGMGGDVNVTVEFSGSAITAVKVGAHNETPGISDPAIAKIPAAVVEGQTLKVDTVAGATITSNALLTAIADCVAQAGGDVEALKNKAPEAVKAVKLEDRDCDLVIVGAGGAGMVAALNAAQSGVKDVVIVEKMPMSGGNTARSTGGMNAAGTKLQNEMAFKEGSGVEKTLKSAKEQYGEQLGDLIAVVEKQWADYQANPQGYFDTPELFALDTMIGGYGKNNLDLVMEMTKNSAAACEWLETIGAGLNNVGAAGGAAVKRSTRPLNAEGKAIAVGSYLVPAMTKACEENEAITMLYDTKATEILMKDGVAGGIAVEAEGQSYHINAKAVIIASGGFGANEEMYGAYKPELIGYVTTNAPGITGDGIKMAVAVGADTVDMEQIQIHPTVEQTTSSLITESIRGDGAILVNQEGVRFYDEVSTRDRVSAAENAQTGSRAYLIVDQKMYDKSAVIAGYVKKGFMKKAETVEELASIIGCDAETLAKTLETWNGYVAARNDPDFGRTSFAEPLDVAPYYVVTVAPGVHHTMGGLVINTDTQVLNTEGNVIPGLYAAGEVTGGVHGANRLGGNAVADIIVFGRIAGANAAAYIG